MSVNKVNQTTGELSPIAGGTLYADMAVGSIVPFGGTVIPDSFLLCDGTAVSRTTYAELFEVIGTSFGAGDGLTSFNLPDLREAVPKGAGLTGKVVGAHLDADGLAVGEFLDDKIQNIVGTGGPIGWSNSSAYQSGAITQKATGMTNLPAGANVGASTYVDFDASRIARTGDTTEVKSVGVNYIIKAKKVGIPTDFKDAIQDSYSTEEVKTNKTWIDGKPIYRKVIEKTVTLTGNSWVSTSIDVSEIDTLCDCTMLSHKFAFGGFYTRKNSNQLDVYCVSNANWSIDTFILEYTKTID